MRTAFVLLALGLATVTALPQHERIVGGSVVPIYRYPMAAAMLYSHTGSGTFYQECGGSIINNRSILSAVHCFIGDPIFRWRARVGSGRAHSGGVVHNTGRMIFHPNYNAATKDNDIAILHMTTAFGFNLNVQPGSIPSPTYNLRDNQAVHAIGWGRTSYGGPSSEDLRQVQIWTINQNTCRLRYQELRRTITYNMLCSGWLDVGGRDQCQGDSGGPLLYNNNVIVGVCSWGHECARPRYPGVNARVTRFTNWIRANA